MRWGSVTKIARVLVEGKLSRTRGLRERETERFLKRFFEGERGASKVVERVLREEEFARLRRWFIISA